MLSISILRPFQLRFHQPKPNASKHRFKKIYKNKYELLSKASMLGKMSHLGSFVFLCCIIYVGSPLVFIKASHFGKGNLHWGFSKFVSFIWHHFALIVDICTFIHVYQHTWQVLDTCACYILKIYHPVNFYNAMRGLNLY